MSEPAWIPLGGQGVDYKGDWAAGTAYAPGDVVRVGGVDYLAVNPSTGQAPPTARIPSGELAYVERTTDLNITATSEGAAQTFASTPAITFDGATAVFVELFAPVTYPPTDRINAQLNFDLWVEGVLTGRLAQQNTPVAGYMATSIFVRRKLTPSSGAKQISVGVWAPTPTTNAIVRGGTGVGNALVPAYIRVSRA